MSETITVGDLVVKIRTCCAYQEMVGGRSTGVPFIVERIGLMKVTCSSCGWSGTVTKVYGRFEAPMSWVKRIPPLGELEGERTQEDLREPA